jgi:hypothetical protein
MTLSNVAPVVDPWQTAALTATSTRLVATTTCSAATEVTARVSLFDSAATKVSTAPDITCDGKAHASTFTVTKGSTYYVSFYASGASVSFTASVAAG